jgi:hypothetical protein
MACSRRRSHRRINCFNREEAFTIALLGLAISTYMRAEFWLLKFGPSMPEFQ